MIFERYFFDLATNSHCLNVTPKTHKYVEHTEIGHKCGLRVSKERIELLSFKIEATKAGKETIEYDCVVFLWFTSSTLTSAMTVSMSMRMSMTFMSVLMTMTMPTVTMPMMIMRMPMSVILDDLPCIDMKSGIRILSW